MNRRRSRQCGVGLIEGLIALAVLSFGVLGMARFQIGMLKQSSDSQARMAAATLSEELLSYVRIDPVNAACYTLPQNGACASDVAKSLATKWSTAATTAGMSSATASMPSPTQFKASLGWSSHAFVDTRVLEATTDVRP